MAETFYLNLTSDLKVSSSTTRGLQLSSFGTFFVPDSYYDMLAAAFGKPAAWYKEIDRILFLETSPWQPDGCFCLTNTLYHALIVACVPPIDGVRLFVAEPAPGARTKTFRSTSPEYTSLYCSGVTIISEVPLSDYIQILRDAWPAYYP
ncbi:MAG: hypothetical protein LBQ57_13355 [Spirochaetales bacterium]|jgi:hypothetical protein|nr:hypothetical protein [Spirochaetales bacterium]